jgi:predicted metalloprotease with PDZ domain
LRLDHDRHPWPHGLDEAAYVKPDAVFLTGMALFLSPDDTAGATVRFELPPGWRASTPWNRNPDGSFGVPTGGELLSNVVMLGQHDERVFMQDGMRVTLAVGGSMKASAPMLESVMKPAVAAYARMFGGVPKSNYLVTLHEGLTDGGAFNRSYSMLAGMPLTRTNLIDWGHIVAHETLHLWNGTGMRPKTQMDWFKEGFTDYLTIITLRRLGLIDEALFTKKLESHVRRTLGPKTLPLAEAGKDKKANWAWIYGGGAMAAMALDAQIREATREQHNLETVMQNMFSLHRDQPFELADLVRVTTAVAGSDTGSFFARHIAGMEPLPLHAAFARVGYELVANTQGEVFLVLLDEPSPAQRQARDAWLTAQK